MNILDISEKFEEIIYKLDKKTDVVSTFNLFSINYSSFLQKLSINTAKFCRENLNNKERNSFIISYEQIKQWNAGLNTNSLSNEFVFNKVANDLKAVSVISMDLLYQMDLNKDKSMENEIYQSGVLEHHQKENMIMFLDKEIGTEYEVNNDVPNEFTISVFDLTPTEVIKIKDFESYKLDESYEKDCVLFKIKGESETYRSPWHEDYEVVEDLLSKVKSKNKTVIDAIENEIKYFENEIVTLSNDGMSNIDAIERIQNKINNLYIEKDKKSFEFIFIKTNTDTYYDNLFDKALLHKDFFNLSDTFKEALLNENYMACLQEYNFKIDKIAELFEVGLLNDDQMQHIGEADAELERLVQQEMNSIYNTDDLSYYDSMASLLRSGVCLTLNDNEWDENKWFIYIGNDGRVYNQDGNIEHLSEYSHSWERLGSKEYQRVVDIAIKELGFPEYQLLYEGDTVLGKAMFNSPEGKTLHVDYKTQKFVDVSSQENTSVDFSNGFTVETEHINMLLEARANPNYELAICSPAGEILIDEYEFLNSYEPDNAYVVYDENSQIVIKDERDFFDESKKTCYKNFNEANYEAKDTELWKLRDEQLKSDLSVKKLTSDELDSLLVTAAKFNHLEVVENLIKNYNVDPTKYDFFALKEAQRLKSDDIVNYFKDNYELEVIASCKDDKIDSSCYISEQTKNQISTETLK